MGNGSTTEFNFNFPYFESTNIVVTLNNQATTGYTVIGTPAGADADIPYTGGKVVFETAPTALDCVTIARSLPLARIVDYQQLAKINPTTLNQDINYVMEVIKDRKDELDTLCVQYADIADKESTTTLLARIAALSQQITDLGDISTLRSDVATNTNNIGTLTNNVGALDTRTTGLIDYVIASQTPTSANNYTWYRKYKSGWVEQGGRHDGDTEIGQVNLHITMANTSYAAYATRIVETTADDAAAISLQVRNMSTTGFQVRQTYSTSDHNGTGRGPGYAYNWMVFGMAA